MLCQPLRNGNHATPWPTVYVLWGYRDRTGRFSYVWRHVRLYVCISLFITRHANCIFVAPYCV